MSFKEGFIKSLDEKYKDELFLIDLYNQLFKRLEEFNVDLEKYSNIGIEVVFDYGQDSVILKIDDDFLRIELDLEDEAIIITGDDVINEDSPHLIDKIKPVDDGGGFCIYWNHGIEKAFDYYLKKAFEYVL